MNSTGRKPQPKSSVDAAEAIFPTSHATGKRCKRTNRVVAALTWLVMVVAIAASLPVILSKEESITTSAQQTAFQSSRSGKGKIPKEESTIRNFARDTEETNTNSIMPSDMPSLVPSTIPSDAPSDTPISAAEEEGATKPPPEHFLDYGCQVHEDCVVMNVGNCCGYYPECVHKSSTPDPSKSCPQDGDGDEIMGICGWTEIEKCVCESNRCQGIQE